jgi:hypothetical protein
VEQEVMEDFMEERSEFMFGFNSIGYMNDMIMKF